MANRFEVTGVASAQLPMRVLGLFAQQDIPADRVTIERVGDQYRIVLTETALPPHHADVIAEKLRAMVLVATVTRGRLPVTAEHHDRPAMPAGSGQESGTAG